QMGYASETETVLADNDWFRAPAENSGRRSAGTESGSNSESFDEEELFSASGSLSSLHEFSDGDGALSDADSDSRSSSHSGPIVRNGAGPSQRPYADSEVDVDGDCGTAPPLGVKAPKSPGSRPAPKRHARRAREAISDDDGDDADDGGKDDGGADDGDAADIEDAPSGSLRKHRQIAAHRRAGPPAQGGSDNGDSTRLKHVGADNAADAVLARKHKATKRRRPRYDDPDFADENGRPQLVYFASKGDATACRKLLLRGASINTADSQGCTALHEAARRGHFDALKLLLNPPSRARQQQQQPGEGQEGSDGAKLDMASSRLARQLRSPFPNPNAATYALRQTPLHLAIVSDNIDIVRLLLDHGASTSIANARQLTPLDTCSNEDIARLLTDRAKAQRHTSARDKAGQTKLHRACSVGDLEQTVALISQGADVNTKDNAGWTPLHEAALEGHNAVAVALLRRGADFTARGFGGDTPLHDACANGHVDVVRSLLIVGADTTLKNNKGVTSEDMAHEEEQDEVLAAIEDYRRSSLHMPARSAAVGAKQKDLGGAIAGDSGPRVASAAQAGLQTAAGPGAPPPGDNVDRRRHKKSQSKESKGKRMAATKPATAVVAAAAAAEHRHDNGKDTPEASKAYRRELVSLKRLREEAEKPLVNYYFSSTSSKLSRDERKLQVLMGTIERLEKRRPKARRRSSAESLRDETDEASGDSPAARGSRGSEAQDGLRAASQSPLPDVAASTSKRWGGRVVMKRAVDATDDNNSDGESDGGRSGGDDNARGGTASGPPQPQQRQRHSAKRAKHAADDLVSVLAGSTGAAKHAAPHSSLFGEAPAAGKVTVEIKSEPPVVAGHTVVHAPPPAATQPAQRLPQSAATGGSRKATMRKTSGGGRRDRPPKHGVSGGRTIVEDLSQDGRAGALTPSAIAAQAIRYLPLYTIQLHTDPPTSKLDYYVVDLQIRLLLGMSIDTPTGTTGSDAGEANPLFQTYPQLCRLRITEAQKERLWAPLAGMLLSNMQAIHDSAAQSRRKTDGADGALAVDSELVRESTVHEKGQFVALGLFFVKLDEVVRIIRNDYPQISKQLITITLDLSRLGIAVPAVASAGASPAPGTWPRLASEGARSGGDGGRRCPVWSGPHRTLPLRYALKLHYRERMEYLADKGDSGQ
ncbi:hypothetical protein LPJ61_002543, partial [Coemansia biformis]